MMLTKFAVKNYRGFKERIEWDLSNPSNYEFNTFAIKDGIITKVLHHCLPLDEINRRLRELLVMFDDETTNGKFCISTIR